MFNNLAFSNPISEITDTALESFFIGVEIFENKLMTREELYVEG